MNSLASMMSPLSKHSSSGSTPAAWIVLAISIRISGTFMKARTRLHMVQRSSEQMSGFSATTCCVLTAAVCMLVPGPALLGSSFAGTNIAPGPVVRLMSRSTPLARMRSTTSR